MQLSLGQAPPGPGKFYSGHGFYSDNCPIGDCSTRAASCEIGKFLSGCGGGTADGTCVGCSTLLSGGALPQNAEWTSNGGQSSTGCTWRCTSNYALNGGGTACELKQCASNGFGAVLNSVFKDGINGQYPTCQYECSAGYFPVGTTSRGPERCDGCAAGTVAARGVSGCSDCPAGFFSAAAAGQCTACPANTFSDTTRTADKCSDCTYCLSGQFKQGCGGSNSGSCSQCTQSTYTPP